MYPFISTVAEPSVLSKRERRPSIAFLWAVKGFRGPVVGANGRDKQDKTEVLVVL